MASLQRLSVVCRSIRCMSDIALRESQPSKFVVVNGKFVRVHEKSPSVTTEEVTHTGQVFFSIRCLSIIFHNQLTT